MESIAEIIKSIGIPEVITSLGSIIAAWFAYNQYTKNKKIDLKIDRYKEEMEIKHKKRNDNSSIVYSQLWKILFLTKADRVYILQPHPLGNACFLSVYYEVKRTDKASVVNDIVNIKMSNMAVFARSLATNNYLYISDINKQVNDKYAKSLLLRFGAKKVGIKKLIDNTHDWIGSIFCEFADENQVIDEKLISDLMHEVAINIQYILPEYKE